jgi:hypothetical protein
MTPYAGHGFAINLPPSLCPNGICCNTENQNRRVVVVRIDTTASTGWGGQTPALIYNGVENAINQWNNATDSNGNRTGYYFVLDQGNATGVSTADITVRRNDADPYFSTNTLNEPGSSARTNQINVNSRYTDPNSPSSTISVADFGGSISHEIGHLIGLVNNRPENPGACNTIMRGIADTSTGTGLVTTVQASDVAAVNRHFASRSNCSVATAADTGALFDDPTPTPTPTPEPTPTPCSGQGQYCGYDSDCCDGNVCGEISGACIPCERDTNNPGHGCMPEACIYCYAGEGTYCDPWSGSCWTPIIIDVAGNGFDMTGVDQGVRFDGFGHGVKITTSWTRSNSDDSWLVLDRNGNGTIDNGTELFSSAAPQPTLPAPDIRHGFNALVQYDQPSNGGNSDGVLDQNDDIFSSLRLWQDKNHNGVSESSELKSLPELGLRAIYMDYKLSKRKDRYGNTFKYRAKVIDAEGSQLGRWAYDVYPVGHP